jgi:ribonucleotide reductase beta subunit family protein with ferritin-like domain
VNIHIHDRDIYKALSRPRRALQENAVTALVVGESVQSNPLKEAVLEAIGA